MWFMERSEIFLHECREKVLMLEAPQRPVLIDTFWSLDLVSNYKVGCFFFLIMTSVFKGLMQVVSQARKITDYD